MERKYWRQVDPDLVEYAEELLAVWLDMVFVKFTFPFTGIADASSGVYVTGMDQNDQEVSFEMTWNEMSRMGLIVLLNWMVFHPEGLAIAREVETGVSPYLLVSPDGSWEYDQGIIEEATEQLKRHGLVVPWRTDGTV